MHYDIVFAVIGSAPLKDLFGEVRGVNLVAHYMTAQTSEAMPPICR